MKVLVALLAISVFAYARGGGGSHGSGENTAASIGVKFILIGPHLKLKRESIGTRAGLALRAWMIEHGWIEGPLVDQKEGSQ